MKKRIFSIISATVLMMWVLCSQAFATDGNNIIEQENIQLIAEMSLDEATPSMQEKILEARNTIIFSESWSVDGVEMYIERQDGEIERVPEFSELFPGWDVPKIDSFPDCIEGAEIATDEGSEIIPLNDYSLPFRVYLNKPQTGVNTSPFTKFTHNGFYVKTKVDTLYASEHCNIGFSNYKTGASLGYANELYPTEVATIYTFDMDEFECAVRASTHSNPGYSILIVTHDDNSGTSVK